MSSLRDRLLSALVLMLLAVGCSDPMGDPGTGPIEELPQDLAALIVSDARTGAALSGATDASVIESEIAYVSLPPGTLPDFISVRLRNMDGSGPSVTVPLMEGGFDPVAIPASAGDQLELAMMRSSGALFMAYGRVPAKQPPVVVRTYPAKGRTDVALSVIPTVVFSEPIDPGTLAQGVRLLRGGNEVPATVELVPGLSWQVRIRPLAPLAPETRYDLHITGAIQDADGDALDTAVAVSFVTDTTLVSPAADVARHIIVSEAVRDPASGEMMVYVSAAAGTLPPTISASVYNLRTNTFGYGSTHGLVTAMGGFEPAVLHALPGDSLWVSLLFESSPDLERFEIVVGVPERQAPALVRTMPSDGASQVPVATIPTLVFSEPVDSATLTGAVRLVGGSDVVSVRLQVLPQTPWIVQVERLGAPSLDPETVYQLEVSTSVADLHGEALQASRSATFTTGAAPLAPGPLPTPPANSLVAFSSNRSGFEQILVANGDGSGARVLTTGMYPRLSPDGSKVVFLVDSPDENIPGPPIHVIHTDGSNERLVGYGHDPTWSPDGSRILYVAANDGNDLYTMAADGSGSRLLVAGDSLEKRDWWWKSVRRPSWSPTGTAIAFEYSAWNGIGGPDVHQIWLVDADGSNPRPLGDPAAYATHPAWSPDGTRIAYTAGNTLRTVGADGSDPRTHFTTDAYIASPAWSPAGGHIAFEYSPATGGYWASSRIWVVDVATGGVGPLIPGVADAAFPSYADAAVSWARATP